MIKLKIDVKKVLKEHLFRGEKGTYLDCALMERQDEYGNDGYIVQDLPKAVRDKDPDARGPILGNFRIFETKKAPTPKSANH